MKSALAPLTLSVLAAFALAGCSTSLPKVEDPYSGRLGLNGTSNNMGAGPSNAYGNMAGMTGSPNWISHHQSEPMGAQ